VVRHKQKEIAAKFNPQRRAGSDVNKRRVGPRLLRRCAGANAAKFIRRPTRRASQTVRGGTAKYAAGLSYMSCPSAYRSSFLPAECCAKRSIERQNSTPCRRADAHHKVSRCAKILLPAAYGSYAPQEKALRRTPGYVSRKSR